jgi:RimJ/RimL family protein N-acetyltransferase
MMIETEAEAQVLYPRTIRLDDGQEVAMRLMIPADAIRMASFARSLPQEDLLYLRMDITKLNVLAAWGRNIKEGRTITVLAEVADKVVGYGSLHFDEVTWQRHLGEIRMQVAPLYRSRGLGRAVGGAIFAIARRQGLHKVIAQMTTDQKGAIATVERMGFQREAILKDFVIDREGTTRDLIVMSVDVGGGAPPS